MSNPHYLKGTTSTKATPSKSENTGLTSAAVDVANIPVQKLELGTALIIGKGLSLVHEGSACRYATVEHI